MASTVSINATIQWTQQFVKLRPLSFPGSNINEPALTSARNVLKTILGPPFAWRWNRNVITFSANSGLTNPQDYPTAAPNFGWIEHASVQNMPTDSPASKWYPVNPVLALTLDSSPGRPEFVSAEADDNAGNITFRFQPAPDQNYPISITTQNKAPQIASLNATWTPVPDEFGYLYEWGFLALMLFYADDVRFQLANQKFVAHLLGCHQGLSETQINLFLNQWQAITGESLSRDMRLRQGVQARGT